MVFLYLKIKSCDVISCNILYYMSHSASNKSATKHEELHVEQLYKNTQNIADLAKNM